MSVNRTHILRQTPVIAALVRTAALTVVGGKKTGQLATPTPTLVREVAARNPTLVRDYIKAVGGDPSWYKGVVPPHMFPQWGFPLQARTLENVPYDMRRVLNGGVRIEINAPISAKEPLFLRANLESIDDNGSRAVMHQRLVTGTKSEPEAVVSHMYAIVPLKKSDGPKKDKPRVGEDARELARFKLTPDTAWQFAVLTGDFNPIHWIPAAARAAGFKNTILHGFATLAFAIEGLNKARFAGNPSRLATIDARFTRPLVLPKKVGLYADGTDFWVGDAPGGPAYLVGSYTTR